MRPTLEDTMMDIAGILAQRATCQKLKVGAVITDANGRIIGSGYNGVPKGFVHCIDVPCPGADAPKGADLCEAVHAEQNALLNCRELHHAHRIYVTHVPCKRCMKTLLNTSIQELVFAEAASTENGVLEMWVLGGRRWHHLT